MSKKEKVWELIYSITENPAEPVNHFNEKIRTLGNAISEYLEIEMSERRKNTLKEIRKITKTKPLTKEEKAQRNKEFFEILRKRKIEDHNK